MKNITLPPQFFAQLLTLNPDLQQHVISICNELAAGDEDTIRRYRLPDNAPDVLVDFVKRLKRRVHNSHLRRERLKAKARKAEAQANVRPAYIPPTTLPTPPKPDPIIDEAIKKLTEDAFQIKKLYSHYTYNVVHMVCHVCNDLIVHVERRHNQQVRESRYNKR